MIVLVIIIRHADLLSPELVRINFGYVKMNSNLDKRTQFSLEETTYNDVPLADSRLLSFKYDARYT